MPKTKREIVAKLLGCKPEDFQAFVEREDGSVVVLNARLQKYKFSAETIAVNQDLEPAPVPARPAGDTPATAARKAKKARSLADRSLEALWGLQTSLANTPPPEPSPEMERPDPRPVPEAISKVASKHAISDGDGANEVRLPKKKKRSKK